MLRSETAAEPDRMRRALEGLRAYQEAPRRPPTPPMPVVAKADGASLRNYGKGEGSGPPLLFVPSLINPPDILDLGAERSLLRWLAAEGRRPLLVDWGSAVEERRGLGVAGHIEAILLPLIAALDEPPALVGYCLGGAMILAAAALAPVRSVATIAAPWHFSAYPEDARDNLLQLWEGAEPTVRALGLLPMEILQSAFWALDPARTIAKYEAFAAMAPSSPEASAFVALEDWANDGPPLPKAAARELFVDFFREDRPGTAAWQVGGQTIDPGALSCPQLHIASITDRIVPHASTCRAGERIDLALGHVGMMVGSHARTALWEPLSEWLSRAPGEC